MTNLKGRLWCNQLEEDFEEGKIGIENDEDVSIDDQGLEDEEQSVNGKDDDKKAFSNNDQNGTRLHHKEILGKIQELHLSKVNMIHKEENCGGGTASPNSAKVKPKESGMRKIEKGDGKIKEVRQTPPAAAEVRRPKSKEQQVIPNHTDQTGENEYITDGIMNVTTACAIQKGAGQAMISKSLIPKPIKNQLVPNENNGEDTEKLRGAGKDMDEESTTQNFQNVTRKGDLSPRHVDRRKSVGQGRKKQHKNTANIQPSGVQIRRTISKSNN